MDPNRTRVLIIGGGIAGPALALFLQRAGFSSRIYEAYPYMEGVGGGFNIASNGMHVLAQLGLADDLVAAATPALKAIFQNDKGKLIAHMPYGDPYLYGQPALSMSRATLFETLARELKAREIPIHYRKRVVGLEEAHDRVTAQFADGTRATGDLLIGADGVRSAVRKFLMPEGPAEEYIGLVGIGAFVPLADLPAVPLEQLQALTFTFGPRGFFGLGGGDTGTMMWWSNLFRSQPFSTEELNALDWDVVRREMLERFGGYCQPIPTLIEKTKSLLRINIYDVRSLPTWHKGRILLIGDAAHAVSPNSGQGASMALEDSILLARLLRDLPRHELTFEEFQRLRKPRVEKIVAEGRRRAGDKEIVSPFQAKIREPMMGFFIRLFGERSQRWIFDYKIDWEGSAGTREQLKELQRF